MPSFGIDSRLLLDTILAIKMETEFIQVSANEDALMFVVGNEVTIKKAIIPRNSFVEFEVEHPVDSLCLHPDYIIKFLRLCLKKDSPSLVVMSIDVAFKLSFQESMQISIPFVHNIASIEFPRISVEMSQSDLSV